MSGDEAARIRGELEASKNLVSPNRGVKIRVFGLNYFSLEVRS